MPIIVDGGDVIPQELGKIRNKNNEFRKIVAGGETVWEVFTFTPADLPGVVGWYEAGPAGVTMNFRHPGDANSPGGNNRPYGLTSWYDLSGNGSVITSGSQGFASFSYSGALYKDANGYFIGPDRYSNDPSSSSVDAFFEFGFSQGYNRRRPDYKSSIFVFGESNTSAFPSLQRDHTLFTYRLDGGNSANTFDRSRNSQNFGTNGRAHQITPSGWQNGAADLNFGSNGNPQAIGTNLGAVLAPGESYPPSDPSWASSNFDWEARKYQNGAFVYEQTGTTAKSDESSDYREVGYSTPILSRTNLRLMVIGDGVYWSLEDFQNLEKYCREVLPTKYP